MRCHRLLIVSRSRELSWCARSSDPSRGTDLMTCAEPGQVRPRRTERVTRRAQRLESFTRYACCRACRAGHADWRVASVVTCPLRVRRAASDARSYYVSLAREVDGTLIVTAPARWWGGRAVRDRRRLHHQPQPAASAALPSVGRGDDASPLHLRPTAERAA
eukprot:1047937-Prorocentrum_minimum.AAC.1